ncbi:hypothetical protein [uncultured Enterovirga sp.]|uniref:hypothetical protein n=1 Tax=uncultured Enterovirga sp. TaxID=2026352 RepID=UPI0035C9B32D
MQVTTGDQPSAVSPASKAARTRDALTTPASRRPIVVVLGMHRSGTSLCAHLLSALGVDMADDVGRARGNEDGHWERWEIVSQHNRILDLLNRPMGGVGDYSPLHDLPLPSGWWANPEVRKIRSEVEAYLQSRMHPAEPFGFKDPRAVRLLATWGEIFNNLSLTPKYVFCVRNPANVAASLRSRDDIPLRSGEYRWLVYNADFFARAKDDVFVLDYDDWFTDGEGTLRRLLAFLRPLNLVHDGSADILDIVDAQLNREGAKGRPSAQRIVQYFYELIKEDLSDPGVRAKLDVFIEQFNIFQRVAPFELPLTRLHGSIFEKTAELEAARDASRQLEHRVSGREQAEADLRSELEASRRAEETAREEAANRAAELQQVGEELRALEHSEHALRTELDGARQDARRRAEEAAALVAGQRLLQDRVAALTEAETRLRADLGQAEEKAAALEAGQNRHLDDPVVELDHAEARSRADLGQAEEKAAALEAGQNRHLEDRVAELERAEARLQADLAAAENQLAFAAEDRVRLARELRELEVRAARPPDRPPVSPAQIIPQDPAPRPLETERENLERITAILTRQRELIQSLRRDILRRDTSLLELRAQGRRDRETTSGPLRRLGARLSGRRDAQEPSDPAGDHPLAPFFDEAYYLESNPDVRAAGVPALAHYLEQGEAEGRRPIPSFDPAFYLDHNEDVRTSGQGAFSHFIDHGIAEGRPGDRSEVDTVGSLLPPRS